MIKRTPQEIADFFGCYVARDADRRWHIFKEKPELTLGYHRKENTLIKNGIYLNPELINTDNVYKLAVLYEPQNITQKSQIINTESDENCQKSGLCPHSDEVYTHKEYRIVTAHKEIDSESFSKGVMAWIERGWVPSGGISFDKQGCPYQALVRGV